MPWQDLLKELMRPSNNLGRNCFRIYAIQQEFCKAHALCTMHLGAHAGESEYPVLSRICSALP